MSEKLLSERYDRIAGYIVIRHGGNIPDQIIEKNIKAQVARLEAENERRMLYGAELAQERNDLKKETLREGIQDVRNVAGTEWGRVEMNSPWGKALFWIMQKCEALLKGKDK